MRLGEEEVFRVVALQDIEEEPAARLELPRRLPGAREPGKDETRSRVRSTRSGKARGGVRRGVVTTTREFATRSSVRPSRLLSSWRSRTSRCAWERRRFSGS